ncbi:MAG: hypothetical protein HKN62_17435 [Phycisphaerales bacterium]|nr:hypothetical protein [Phycisphaerales bacterium]
MTSAKKREKTDAKLAKKRAKAELKSRKQGGSPPSDGAGPSPAVRYAEMVRGVLYLTTGLSLSVALLLGQRGVIISLNDVIDSLFVARSGKVVLALIAAALAIYGMKHLRIVR